MRFAFLFPRFKILSGAERLILKLAGALVEKGHEIHILCHQFDSSCSPLLAPGIQMQVSGVPLDHFKNRYLNAAFDYIRSGKLTDQLPANLDAACCFGPGLAAAVAVRRRTSAPVLYFCYEPPRFLYTDRQIILDRMGVLRYAAGPVFSMYQRRDRKMVRMVDAVLSNSEFGRRQIQEVYGRDATVITHGLHAYRAGTRRAEIRKQWGLKENHTAVLTVNYLHPRKRIDLFVEAVLLAQKTNSSVRGIIVGDGPERVRLQKLAGDAAFFTGFVREEDLFEYYQAADMYLHTGRLETFGLSVIEAAGNALPVISVNEGGPMETIIDGRTGILREANATDLAGAIAALAADPEGSAGMGRAGDEYVRSKYSWSQGAEDFLRAVER